MIRRYATQPATINSALFGPMPVTFLLAARLLVARSLASFRTCGPVARSRSAESRRDRGIRFTAETIAPAVAEVAIARSKLPG